MQEGTTRQCVGCGKEIIAGPRERRIRKWCTESCRAAAYMASKRGEGIQSGVDYMFTCQHCEKVTTRKLYRVKPKYCSDQCRNAAAQARIKWCLNCGQKYTGRGGKYCSRTCATDATSGSTLNEPGKYRAMRHAWENDDYQAFMIEVQGLCEETASGCWNWPRTGTGGYPFVSFGKGYRVHRMMASADRGSDLGVLQVHHTCANRRCVNPAHLQAITQQENMAEMIERKAYLRRIKELESALREINPEHPLLRP